MSAPADMDFNFNPNRPLELNFSATICGQSVYNALPLERPRHRFALNNNHNGNSEGEIDVASEIELQNEEIERMDRAYARALQLRELRARNLDDNNMDLLGEPEWHEFIDDILMLDMMDPSDTEDPEDLSPPDIPTYPVGVQVHSTECLICYETCTLTLRPCCQLPVCPECLGHYLTTQVNQANVRIECLSKECSSYIHRDEILAKLDQDTKQKYYKFLVDANQDPHIKTCPRCSHVMTLNKNDEKQLKSQSRGLKVTCDNCSLVWCFPCQAPWHEGIQCKEFRKGDKLLKAWAREQRAGQHNAQRCPRCKVYIQRAAGCDHMICSRCKTNFCYRCGERFRHIKFIGDHYSRLSVFGCRYRFLPDRPVKRKLIRGAILGGKLLAAPVVAGLAVGGAALVVGFGTIAAPIYGGYKLHKRMKERKRRQRRAVQNVSLGHYVYPVGIEEVLRREGLLHDPESGTYLFDTNDYLNARLPISRLSDSIVTRRSDISADSTPNPPLPSISARVSAEEVKVDVSSSCVPPVVHKRSDEEETRETVTTAQVVRQDSAQADQENSDYPLEILNVVTRYTDGKDGDGSAGAESFSVSGSKKALKTDAYVEAEACESTCKPAVTSQSQSKSSTASDKGKSCVKNHGKALAMKEMDTNLSETEIQTNNNNSMSKSHGKEGEGKTISHMPWLNIVCGKIAKDKEMTPKKSSKTHKFCDTNSEAVCILRDENLNTETEMSGKMNDGEICSLEVEDGNSVTKCNQKKKEINAFGPESDEDDISTSSSSSSPLSASGNGYYCPVADGLNFIDEEYIAQCSEMTSL